MDAVALGRRYDASPDAIKRHRRNHLSPQMRAAILAAQKPASVDLEVLQRSESEGLLAALVSQRARLQQHVDMALEVGDVRAGVAAERAITDNLSLVSKLLGMLVQHHEVKHTSVLISSDYLRLRRTIIEALRPFPDAARSVGVALAKLETEAAEVITGERPMLAGPVTVEAETLP